MRKSADAEMPLYGPLDENGGDSSLVDRSHLLQKVLRYLLGLVTAVVLLLLVLTANQPGGIEPLPVAIDLEFLVVLAFPAAFILAFSNGANDCANRCD